MLINKPIPGLFNGVSQQAPGLRLDTQCELMENAYPSLAEGMSKRPPTEHLAVLSSNAGTGSFIHTINRDSTERYTVVFTTSSSEPVEIYTMAGVKCTVVADSLSKAYLTTANPAGNIKATTVADYTLISNASVKCAMGSGVSAVDKPCGIIYVSKGVAGQTYSVLLNEVLVATYTSGDTTAYDTYRSTTIAKTLYESLVGLATNQLVINFASATAVYNDTVTISIGGVQIGSPVRYAFDWVSSGGEDPGGWVLNVLDTATAVAAMLKASINTAAWAIFQSGGTVYIKKMGATAFVSSITGGNPGVTQPNLASQWDIDYVLGTSAIRVTRLDGQDFGFSVADSYGNQAIIGIKGKAQKFGDLPPVCFEGARVEITGEPTNNFDNFHMKYTTQFGQATGLWMEVVKQGLKDSYDPATMPHQLVRTAVNTFTLSPVAWIDRKVGDDSSNPPASFIGSSIVDIFFYRNRLGFLAGENVILSKSGEFFDFWSNTATAVLDSDPIDISCPTSEVTQLLHAIPFPKSLFLVGAQQQFSLNSGNLNMTPKTVAVDAVTHFEVSPLCQPVVAGANVYLPVPRGNATSLREYFISADSFSTDAADITAHVPTFIPKNVVQMAASSTFDFVVALSTDTPTVLYFYKYYWAGEQKAQSAWSKWIFDGSVLSCAVLSNYLYLIIKRGTEVCLERVRLDNANSSPWLSYRVHLDRLAVVTGTFGGMATTFPLPYAMAAADTFQYMIIPVQGGAALPPFGAVDNTLNVLGSHLTPCFVGRRYTKRFRFSEWKVKAQGSNVGVLQGRLQIRNITLGFSGTNSSFTVEFTPSGRDTQTMSFNGTTTGEQRFPIMTNAQGATIDIVNDSHLPSCFHSASYEGFFTVRSRTN